MQAKQARGATVVRGPRPGPMVVRVDGKGKRVWYLIRERDPDPGPPRCRVFAVARLGAAFAYTVKPLPDMSCECPAWYTRGRCVHTGLLFALERDGRL
jgi:hypothetical protein